jgi:hypothetical protein
VRGDQAAETLLRDLLSPLQYRQVRAKGYLEVPSPTYPGRIYLVPRGPGQVAVLEGGQVVESLCVHPVGQLPEADLLLVHKLLIEADESSYLQAANHFPCTAWSHQRPLFWHPWC